MNCKEYEQRNVKLITIPDPTSITRSSSLRHV